MDITDELSESRFGMKGNLPGWKEQVTEGGVQSDLQ